MLCRSFILRILSPSGLVALASCQQDPTAIHTLVSGKVVEYQSGKSVDNAEVQVYFVDSGGNKGRVDGGGSSTDSQGNFSFSFEAPRAREYRVRASAKRGYTTDWTIAPTIVAGRSNENLVVTAYANAFVKLQLVDVPPRNRVKLAITENSLPFATLLTPETPLSTSP